MLNKDKIVRAEIFDREGRCIVSTQTLDFPKDFFNLKGTEFVIFKSDKVLPINKGEKVSAIFFYRNGTRIQYDTVIDVATEMQVNVHLGRDYKVLEERRRYYKTQTDLEAMVTEVFRGEEKPENSDKIPVRIANMNIGGVFMLPSAFEFWAGDRFILSMINDKIVVMCEVLRLQRDTDNNLQGYGCRFESLTKTQEEIIGRFLIECQLAERERLKNMGL